MGHMSTLLLHCAFVLVAHGTKSAKNNKLNRIFLMIKSNLLINELIVCNMLFVNIILLFNMHKKHGKVTYFYSNINQKKS